ncbi:MAG: deoxyribose-phosphate aldolase [Clostridiales bacterium]|nr:deoxyribose-phosphate aldolase [Clostridiales bacterium]
MPITLKEIAKMLDHSTLQPFLTEADIRKGCDIALQYDTATVCARPGDMPLVVRALAGSTVLPCTVIGFPHGAHHTAVKLFEAERALDDGCRELDMVLNIGRMLSGDTAYVQDEIARLAEAAHARNALLKVILETCYLSDEQKRIACRLSEQAGADFVKTSTGYGSAGATVADVKLMRAAVSDGVRVKASGGIRTLDMVLACRQAGASRCGVSATAKIMEEAINRQKTGALTESPAAPAETAGGSY